MPFNPSLPANGSPLSSAEMRGQLTSLKALIDAISSIASAQVDATSTLPPGNPANVSVSVVGNTLHFTFNIPQGENGAPGEVTQSQLDNAIAATSNNTNSVSTLGMSADSSYNQQQMQDVMNKLDEFINAARR